MDIWQSDDINCVYHSTTSILSSSSYETHNLLISVGLTVMILRERLGIRCDYGHTNSERDKIASNQVRCWN
jgi:hypothetical protein